jgi:copper transport protein
VRRAAALALLLGALMIFTAPRASAHAVVRSSSPANGSVVDQAPTRVTIEFTERPDLTLTSIQVLASSGHDVARGKPQPVPGQPDTLRIGVGPMPDGVYTVTWRTVSADDGHTTAGSFSFGVGVSPGTVPTTPTVAVPKTPPPPPLAVAGRWALYWGLALLFAAAITGFLVFRGTLPVRAPALAGGAGAAVLGIAAMIVAQRSSAGVSYGTLFSSTTGHHLVRELVAVGVAAAAAVLALARRRPWTLLLVGAAAAAAMLMHALNSHAAAGSYAWFNVSAQFLHLLSVSAWVGGLVWLILGLHHRTVDERTPIAQRFSRLATISLVVVAATGIVRALDEVGPPPDWGRFLDAAYGITLLVKLALFVGLVAFGARNRFVNVPGLTGGTRQVGSLRRTVVAEVVIAAGILGATGLLSELPPAAVAASNKAPTPGVSRIVATGHDFATSVRVRLVVTPGTVGPNEFRLRADDFDTHRPVRAGLVNLTFSLPGHPEIGRPTLRLRRHGDEWTGSGTVLSMFGRWNVTVLVQEPSGGVDVPLAIMTRLPPQGPIQQIIGTGDQPTLYTVPLADGSSLQGYVDPGSKPGPNTVHFTFFTAAGKELPIASATATEISPDGDARPLHLIRFDKGHFVSNVKLGSGAWTFLINATPRTESPVTAYFKHTIG